MKKKVFKFKKDKTYEALFLSDVHYLLSKKIRMHRHKELFQMLDMLRKRGVRFREIYLVGDIIENWYFSAERKLVRKFGKKRFNKLFDRIDALGVENVLKVYILGNHDSFSYIIALPPKIEAYLRARKYQICEKYETSDRVIVHGHQGQYGKFFWFLNIMSVRILHFVASLYPKFFTVMENFYRRHFNFDRNETEQEVKEFYDLLSERTRQGKRLLICGHTHQFYSDAQRRWANTGDWIDSRTFLVQKGNQLFGLEYAKKKQCLVRYVLPVLKST